ncbi:hypothetical protein EPO15_11610 [bacterium]|nr:MAG: hypothetical protein EPO15_11610 [bacterium]
MKASLAYLLSAGLFFACAGPRATPPPAPEPVPDQPDALLKASRDAYASGQFSRGLELVKRLIEVSPDKGVAYDRVGSVYFALGRGDEALGMWETALALEQDPERKAGLTGSIMLARRSLGMPEAAPPAEPPPPRVKKPPVKKPPKGKKPPKAPALTDREMAQAAYDKGVEKYASGEYLAATTLFLEALDIDPTHEPARKALERLKMKPTP